MDPAEDTLTQFVDTWYVRADKRQEDARFAQAPDQVFRGDYRKRLR